jgi:two-component system chemotaxis response regulator CheY
MIKYKYIIKGDFTLEVLVVDDSKTMQRIIKNSLHRIGLEKIYVANDGEEAFEIFNNKNFDLLITDWNMPNMNGLELVKKVRENNQNIPIIMVTTEGGKKEVITALKAGVNNYIVKPFTPQTLKEKLNLFIGGI